MRFSSVGVFVVLAACAPEVPKQLDSPFSMATHSLAFANFAEGYPDSQLDADLMVRMFGDQVCQTAASPCELTPAARAFAKRANRSMSGGRCEGFAVLASLFEAGQLDPVDFDGASARELTLEGNARLQREIAYWFSTQLVPEASSSKTKQYMAKDVMPALAQALAKDSKERWRLGIVRKKGRTISGGHALTPIGYYSDPKEKGVYWLRVYDNNRPDAERLMKIDTVNNRWEFEASENPEKSPRLYYGDASNKNPLYLAPVFTRQGTLPCEFCKGDGTVQVTTTGGAQASSSEGGVSDGELSGQVTPGFSAEFDNEPATFIANLPASAVANLVLTRPEDADFPFAEQGVEVAGSTFTVSVQDVQITSTDTLQVQNNGGAVKYTNASGSSLALKTELALADGGSLSVSAVVSGASSDVSANVDPDTGKVSIEAGNSEGAQVTMVVTTTNGAGEETSGQLTFTSNGDGGITADTSGWAAGDPLTGTVTNAGMTMTVTNACEDGVRSGMETDVDCGAVCTTKCAVDQGCNTGADCQTTFCHGTTKKCVATSCEDAVRSGDESDVDCGGASCASCAVGKACTGNGDCASNAACVGNVCTATWVVGLTVSGLPSTALVVVQNNGADDLSLSGNGSFAFPTRVVGPYAVTILTQPGIATCTVVNGSGTATANVSDVQVNCTPTWAVAGTVSGLPAGQSVVLQNGADTLTATSDGAFTFNTRVTGAYAVTVQTQPAGASCAVTNGAGTATADVTNVTVTCSADFAIGGTVSGLPASQSVVLQNGAETLTATANGAFTFPTRVMGAYAVTVQTQPTGALCAVTNGSGTATADVTTVQVTCTPTWSIGGTLSGLPASQSVVLQNGAETLTATANGAFTFTTRVTGAYAVTVQTQPAGALCAVTNGSGTATADVTTVQVTCGTSGTLDTTFNSTGIFVSSQSSGTDVLRAAVTNVDNSLVFVGERAVSTTDSDIVVVKVDYSGNLDGTFGTGGVVTLSNGVALESARHVARDGTGGYFVVGTLRGATSGNADVGMMRLTAAGVLDTTFGTNGLVTHDSGQVEYVEGVMRDTAGRTVAVGRRSASGSGPHDVFAVRLNTDGSLDTTFGTSGWFTWDGGGDEGATSVTRDPNGGNIVMVASNGADTLVLQLIETNGTLWTSFGTGGVLTLDMSGAGRNERPSMVYVWATDLYVVGRADGVSNADLALVKLDAAGGLDPTFGVGGRLLIDRGGSEVGHALERSPSGGWYVGGQSGSQMLVTRVTAGGTVDTSFAANGFFENAFSSAATAYALLVDVVNQVVAIGTIGASGSEDLGVVRINP